MTETHTHSYENEHPHAENEVAPSAVKRTLGKHRFRFLHRERSGNVNWLALGFSAPWLVFLLMPLESFLTAPGLAHEKRPEHSPAFQGSINFRAESTQRSARVRSTGCAKGPLPF